jgi:hypothetical protein
MSKVLEAICVGGVVTSEGVPVPAADILSEGVGASSGVLILDRDLAKYIAKTSPDLKSTLEILSSALTTIATSLTSIGAGMTGPTTAPPPTLAVDVAQITLAVTELDALKEILK